MFAGHQAYRFAQDPLYEKFAHNPILENIPTVEELIKNLLKGD
jgi:hypothetical protein